MQDDVLSVSPILRGFLLGIAMLLGVANLSCHSAENSRLPAEVDQKAIEAAVTKAVETWYRNPDSLMDIEFAPYDPKGGYLHYGMSGLCGEKPGEILIDKDGIAMLLNKGTPVYHPVLMAQCGLFSVSRYSEGKDDNFENAIKYARKLISMQNARGGFPYNFEVATNLEGVLGAGWTSGMAQGQSISLLVRLYRLTGDAIYKSAALKAFKNLMYPVESGGSRISLSAIKPEWKTHIFLEEYPTLPHHSYTLNGYIFALLGIYDLSHMGGNTIDETARQTFSKGVESLKLILPLYDFGRMTSYDLTHLTKPPRPPYFDAPYHAVHIRLLNALNSITDEPVFRETEKRWRSYVEK